MRKDIILFRKKKNYTGGNKRNIGIAVRLTAVSVGMLLFLGMIIITFSAINMGQNIREREKESLRTTAHTLRNAYYVLYEGDFNKLKNNAEFGNEMTEEDAVSSATTKDVDGVSSATKENINAMTIIDTLHDETGIDISIFWGDVSIVTSFKDDSGLRKTGSKLEDEVKEQVIDLAKEYFSEDYYMEEHSHYVYYIPIVNGNEVLGALGVARDRDIINNIVMKSVIKQIAVELVISFITMTILSLILQRISKFIQEASEALHTIADGDLTLELNDKLLRRRDEIGQLGESTLKLRDQIKDILMDIKRSIVTLSGFADELDRYLKKTRLTVDDVTRAMEDVSKGAASQAESTQNANYSMVEVGTEIGKITDALNTLKSRSDDISIASQQADDISDELEISANNTISAIDRIVNQTEETNEAAQEIKKALDVITEIAKRTNLLSLNASIEAARAGEHGKGFGIVASEIKALADQSGKSAKEIELKISKLLEESGKSLEVVEHVKEIISEQKIKLNETRQQFDTVRDGVDESADSIDSIYEKIVIVDNKRNALMETIEVLSAISEENAASSEETSSSTEELNNTIQTIADKASELKSMTKELKQRIMIFKLKS